MRAFASTPHKGGGEELSLSATYGFDVGDRGHIMIGADWYNRESLRQGQRAKILGCQEEYRSTMMARASTRSIPGPAKSPAAYQR